MVSRVVTELGFTPIRTRITGRLRPTLQVMAERADGTPLTIDDCATISRTLSAAFELDDPMPGPYQLEVSSAGIDRPLVTRADFERFVGSSAEVTTVVPIDGRRRFKGRIAGVAEDRLAIDCEAGLAEVPLAAVADARLVIAREILAKPRPPARRTG